MVNCPDQPIMKDFRTFFTKFSWRNWLLALAVVLVSWLVISLLLTGLAARSLAQGKVATSQALFEAAYPGSWLVSRLTFRSWPLAEVWHEGVWLGRYGSRLQRQLADLSLEEQVVIAKNSLGEINNHLPNLAENFQRSSLLSVVIKNHQQAALQLTKFQEVADVLGQLFNSEQRWLILLQNTDELRATGGFIGSYAVIDFSQENPLQLEVRDIYDPSGISISLPSPAGQAEYLSEGQGMRLHDANWSPDFPTAASTIFRYFGRINGDPQSFDGVIALPLSAIETMIGAVGGVYLPDQERTISATEVVEVLRQNRSSFFPGSREKEQALQQLYTALLLRLSQLSVGEWGAVVSNLAEDRLFSELQFYSTTAALQNKLLALNLAGKTEAYDPQEIYVMPVETNVGINKANRKVSRSLSLALADQQLTVSTTFTNHYTLADRPAEILNNPNYTVANHLGYINYHRLLVRSDMRVRSITIDNELLTTWDEEIVVNSSGTSYLQVGFLVRVPEETETTTAVEFSLPGNLDQAIAIQKQVGLTYETVAIHCPAGAILNPALIHNLYQASCQEAVQ